MEVREVCAGRQLQTLQLFKLWEQIVDSPEGGNYRWRLPRGGKRAASACFWTSPRDLVTILGETGLWRTQFTAICGAFPAIVASKPARPALLRRTVHPDGMAENLLGNRHAYALLYWTIDPLHFGLASGPGRACRLHCR